MKRITSTDDALAAVRAYSQATMNGNVLITAGQLSLMTDGKLLDDKSIGRQTEQCLDNATVILESERLSLNSVLKMTVFLDDFDAFNEAYSEYFDEDPPVRSAVEIGAVPKGAAVEIEVIAATE